MIDRSAFRLAFFSDPHLGPLPGASWRELANKRATGWMNWRFKRRGLHDMAALDRIIADIIAAQPDHVICGGDLANLGLPAEFVAARRLLEKFGDPARASVTPGNHSCYLAESVAPMLDILGPWMTGDGELKPAFPYLRRRGCVALIGLNSSLPTPPFDATGQLGAAQIEATFLLLTALKAQNLLRVVLIHHPPHVGGAAHRRRLRDAADFQAMLADVGADLVLHGHNHATSIAEIQGAGGATPVIGVGSASEINPRHHRQPTWLKIDIARVDQANWRIAIEERRVDGEGAIHARPLISLTR